MFKVFGYAHHQRVYPTYRFCTRVQPNVTDLRTDSRWFEPTEQLVLDKTGSHREAHYYAVWLSSVFSL